MSVEDREGFGPADEAEAPEEAPATADLTDAESSDGAAAEPESAADDELEADEESTDRVYGDGTAPKAAQAQAFSVRQVRRARDLLARMYALRRSLKFYPVEHPATRQATRDLFEVISQYHAEGADIPLTFFEDELLLGQQLLTEDSMLFDQLIRDMSAIGAGSITFMRGLELSELGRFSTIIGADLDGVAAAGGLGTWLARLNTPHVVVSTVAVYREEERELDEDERRAAMSSYAGAVDLMRELERLIQTNQTVNTAHVKGVARSLVDGILRNRYAMLELTGLKSYDEYTFYHSVNVAILSIALCSKLTRDYRFLSSLGVGALLHDIGKMTVSAEILNKNGPLNSEEWAEIRRHPIYGAETATLTPALDRAAIVCILEHHLRYDGTGYPTGASGRAQHIASRIVAVADAYDAMTSQRSYSAPRLQDEAIRTLARNAGTALDPTLVRLFVELVGVYPPRSVVRLDSGETAVVISPSATNPTAPRIRLIADADGTLADPAEPVDIDLSDPEHSGGRRVEHCLDPAGLNVDVADFL